MYMYEIYKMLFYYNVILCIILHCNINRCSKAYLKYEQFNSYTIEHVLATTDVLVNYHFQAKLTIMNEVDVQVIHRVVFMTALRLVGVIILK